MYPIVFRVLFWALAYQMPDGRRSNGRDSRDGYTQWSPTYPLGTHK